jgi:hypothetical protein
MSRQTTKVSQQFKLGCCGCPKFLKVKKAPKFQPNTMDRK